MKNYYETLELEKSCSQEEISWAYSRLALKYHPKRNEAKDFTYNNFKFAEIAEAFEVLSNYEFKAIFDFNGYDALTNGILDKQGNLKGGYKFSGNSYKIFEGYFGTKNPYTLIKDTDRINDEFGTLFGSAFGGLYNNFTDPPKDLEIQVELTLEELYIGCFKKVTFNKVINNFDGRTTETIETSKDIQIFKGTKCGDIKIYKGEGNQKPGYTNCNFLFQPI